MDSLPQKLQNVLNLLSTLSDDLVRKIYENHRIDKDGNFIKLINLENYKFLEKILHQKMGSVSKVKIYEEYSGRELPNNILEIKYELANCCELPDREEQSIQNDMMYVYLRIEKDTVSYTIQKFRLKKIDVFFTKDKPVSMYFRGNFPRGNYLDYDWEVFTIASDGSNQDV
jgi:hypothetical protein